MAPTDGLEVVPATRGKGWRVAAGERVALFTSSLDEVRDRIGRLGQAGATDLIMSPLERPDEHLDELSQLL